MKINPTTIPNPTPLDTKSTSNIKKPNGDLYDEHQSTTVTQTTHPSQEVQISEKAKLMREANNIAQQTNAYNADKVKALKKQIQDGMYKIENSLLADKLVDEHLDSDFGKNNL